MFFVYLFCISFLVFFIQKQPNKKVNYLLLFLAIIFSCLFISFSFCAADIDDLGQCSYFSLKITEKNSFIQYLSLSSLLLSVITFLWLCIKLILNKIHNLKKS